MATFDHQDLFSSGPSQFEIGKLMLRYSEQHTPGGTGIQLDALGRKARNIHQTGTLTADNAQALQQRVAIIESKIDGTPTILVDNLRRTWQNVVMTSFTPGIFSRVGVRWKAEYHIEYIQVIT